MASGAAIRLGRESYINIESYRRDGTGVKTPVWCTELDGKLVVVTDGTSYKVKRIRRNPKVRVAPCNARGGLRGEWVDGECRVIDDAEHARRAHAALRAKYGFQFWLLDLGSTLAGRIKRRAYLEISV
jgi:hypothetical protein